MYWHNHDVRRLLFLVLVGMLSGSSTNAPQKDGPARGHYSAPIRYDGRFTLCPASLGRRPPLSARPFRRSYAWNHDYPRAEQNLSAIIRELTYLDIHDDGNEILMLDDPDLFKYPIALMWEPGFWNLTDREAESFRAYLLKGGFAYLRGLRWRDAMGQLRGADAPGAPRGAARASRQHTSIFSNAFFPIKDIDAIVHPMSHIRPEAKRATLRTTIRQGGSSSWPTMTTTCRRSREWSGERLFPFDASNEV